MAPLCFAEGLNRVWSADVRGTFGRTAISSPTITSCETTTQHDLLAEHSILDFAVIPQPRKGRLLPKREVSFPTILWGRLVMITYSECDIRRVPRNIERFVSFASGHVVESFPVSAALGTCLAPRARICFRSLLTLHPRKLTSSAHVIGRF